MIPRGCLRRGGGGAARAVTPPAVGGGPTVAGGGCGTSRSHGPRGPGRPRERGVAPQLIKEKTHGGGENGGAGPRGAGRSCAAPVMIPPVLSADPPGVHCAGRVGESDRSGGVHRPAPILPVRAKAPPRRTNP